MKTMLKVLMIIMALALVLSLAACGEEQVDAPAEETPTVESAPEEQTPEGETAAPEGETAAPTTDATTDATTPTEEIAFDAEPSLEEELLWEDEIGTGPMVTVKYEVYEAMSDSEKEAFRNCFTTASAFDFWEENALMNYGNELLDEEFVGEGSLNLKEIYEMLTGNYET